VASRRSVDSNRRADRVTEFSVGLIGCGTVGGAFAAILAERRQAIETRYGLRLTLKQVAVSRPDLPRPFLGELKPHGDSEGLARDSSLPIVVEASGKEAAGGWLRAAHERGAAVVTANKRALSLDGELLRLLARHDPRLHCEAAVAGGVPVVRGLRESLAGDEIIGIRGLLNGTTTFVLSALERGEGLAESVRAAQAAGYAEPDPSQDLNGEDAGAKLAILATLAWRRPTRLDEVRTRGIDEGVVELVRGARHDGRRVRLVAEARPGNPLQAFVAPALLEPMDPLAATSGADNVIQIDSALAGSLVWRGVGAGGRATASALLADVIAAARWLRQAA
jgi:homoserine dehydrogenase